MSNPDNKMRIEFANDDPGPLDMGRAPGLSANDHQIHKALLQLACQALVSLRDGCQPGANSRSHYFEELLTTAVNLSLFEPGTVARLVELRRHRELATEVSRATLDYNLAVSNDDHYNVIDEQNARFPRQRREYGK